MLTEVRGRAVDVETGMPPAPMRALPRDEAQASLAAEQASRAESAPRPERAKRPRKMPSRRDLRARVITPMCLPPIRERGRSHEEVVDLLAMDAMLNLDDAPTATSDMSRPWARGLRG